MYCRTKAFLDQQQTIEPTEEEILLFALGYGLQDVLMPPNADTPVLELEGIVYRPDITFVGSDQLIEVKTTRRSAKKHYEPKAISDSWLMYMLGGCKIQGTNTYDLIVIYLMGNYSPPFPQLYADTITFTFEEIELNWATIKERKVVLDTALESGIMPVAYEHCEPWECKGCRYVLLCEVLTREGLANGS
jgi:hypothetical protein|tara:strand:+ start:26533 stop:27102 length:570 start_codon:yes stop_codon:yes gene_type:complete